MIFSNPVIIVISVSDSETLSVGLLGLLILLAGASRPKVYRLTNVRHLQNVMTNYSASICYGHPVMMNIT